MTHAVARLRATCLEDAHRPRLDRGEPRHARCHGCRLPASHCTCALRRTAPARAGVCLVMAPYESLKPSNTGWLVADVVADTFAFRWSRTEVDPALLALLDDPRWQPWVVFPREFAAPGRPTADVPDLPPGLSPRPGARPLFVLLDGTWAEAHRMFRRSPWLDRFPVLGLAPEGPSRYALRSAPQPEHLCTAQVAAMCLERVGDALAARTLAAWLDIFNDRYLRSRQRLPPDCGTGAAPRLDAATGS
jgi:DTW domain-containing protein YfiP